MPLDETPSRDPHEPPMEMAEEAMAHPDQSPSSEPSAVAATKENGPVSSPSLTKGETEQRLPPVASANDTAEPSIFHHLKWITWPLLGGVAIPIVTQNENGPCPLVAISNVLLLKRKLTIPSGEEAVQAPRLLDMIGNAMIENVPKNISEAERLNLETNMNDAMLILDRLRTGLDVNVQFSGCRSFEYTPECIIFDLLGIPLYHGWVIDPQSQEYPAVNGCSYNQLVERIFCDKETTDDSDKVARALLAESFLEQTASQLTQYGLKTLQESMGHEELAVLFRNNHFSTIYKYQGRLYILVTDQGFLREPKVVWETLCSVQGDSTFTDAALEPLPPLRAAAEGKEGNKASTDRVLTAEQQADQDLLLAYSLQEEYRRLANQEEQWEEEKKWLTTRDQVPGGCEDKDAPGPTNASGRPLSDEELAHLMQEEENAQAQARGALGEHGHRSHSADQLRRTSPPYPQQMREVGTRERQRRNSSSCSIL